MLPVFIFIGISADAELALRRLRWSDWYEIIFSSLIGNSDLSNLFLLCHCSYDDRPHDLILLLRVDTAIAKSSFISLDLETGKRTNSFSSSWICLSIVANLFLFLGSPYSSSMF